MNGIIKRFLDILIAILGLIISIPIGIVISVIIKITSNGHVIFKQKRLGKNGKLITIYKFRTMIEGAEYKIETLSEEKQKEYANNYRIQDDPRITKVGRVLRESNLDELPQFWNVLIGDMSIVGPRPILKNEIEKYKPDKKKKLLSVKPGLTGYWQINREKCKNYEQRIEMELFYIENNSLKLDAKIFFKTIGYSIKKIFKLITNR